MSWYSDSWTYRKEITINGDAFSDTVYNFPVCFKISGLSTKADDNGTDIIFVDEDDITRICHDLSKYSNNEGIAWVKVPEINSGDDKKIYMYYGNDSGGDQTDVHGYRASSAWDDYYVVLSHMSDYTNSSTIYDYKSKENLYKSNAAGDPPSMVPTYLGSGQKFWGGTNSYISSSVYSEYVFTSGMTVEMIISGESDTSSVDYFVSCYRPGVSKMLGLTMILDQFRRFGYVISCQNGYGIAQLTQQWWPSTNRAKTELLALSFNSGTTYGYKRAYIGNRLFTTSTVDNDGNIEFNCPNANTANSGAIVIGNRYDWGRVMSGTAIDLKISKTPRSSGWIVAESLNVSSLSAEKPHTFFTIGVEESSPEPPAQENVGGNLRIYYSACAYPSEYFECWCKRWDEDNWNITIETFLTSANRDTLFRNVSPGIIRTYNNKLGQVINLDGTFSASTNTLVMEPIYGYGLSSVRTKKEMIVKNISDSFINPNYFNVKIEGLWKRTWGDYI